MNDKPSATEILLARDVIAGMRRAFTESDVAGANPVEHGGFIVRHPDTGQLAVERLPEGRRDSVSYPLCPNGLYNGKEIVGTFHTHPNTGSDWIQGPSPQDIRLSREYPETIGPHQFVISAQTVYHIDSEGVVSEMGRTDDVLRLHAEEP